MGKCKATWADYDKARARINYCPELGCRNHTHNPEHAPCRACVLARLVVTEFRRSHFTSADREED